MKIPAEHAGAPPLSQSPITKYVLYFFAALPLVVSVYMVLVDPRPYYLAGGADNEHYYYFGAKLFFEGHPLPTLGHPGMTVHLTSYAIMSLVGSGLSDAQTFFNLAYLVICVISIAGIALFTRLALPGIPLGLAALSLAFALSGPSFWTYLTHYCADSPTLGLGLMALGLFWSALRLDQPPSKVAVKLALCGVAGALCLTTKLSFLPLIAALMAGCVVRGFFLLPLRRAYGLHALWAPLTTLAISLILAIPFIPMAPSLGTFFRGLNGRNPSNAETAWNNFLALSHWYPFFAAGFAGALLITFAFTLAALFLWWRSPKEDISLRLTLDVHAPSVLTFLGLGLAGLAAVCGCPITNHIDDWGMGFRYLAPAALAVPLAWMLLGTWLAGRRITSRAWFRWAGGLLVALSLVATVAEAVSYTSYRHNFTKRLSYEQTTTLNFLKDFAGPATTIVIWDGSPGYMLGADSFSMWGNYWYCNEMYDKDLLKAIPRFRWLRLRDIPFVAEPSYSNTYEGIADFLPYYRFRARDRVISNQGATIPPLLIAVPLDELRHELGRRWNLKRFSQWIITYLGLEGYEAHKSRHEVAGSEWGLIKITPPESQQGQVHSPPEND